MIQKTNPINSLLYFQHHANHYKNIVNPRKTNLNFRTLEQPTKKLICLSQFNNKFEKQKRQSITRENKRMIKDFLQIQRKQGILQSAQYSFRTIQSQQGQKRSLLNQFKVNQGRDKIKKENLQLRKKISILKPKIGTKQLWQDHEDFNKKQLQKLRKITPDKNRHLSGQSIIKLVISTNPQRINGCLKLFQTLNLQIKQKKLQMKNQIQKIKTSRPSRKRKHKKNNHIKSQNEEQVPQNSK